MAGLITVDHYMRMNKRPPLEPEPLISREKVFPIQAMTEQEFEEVYGSFTDMKRGEEDD